MRPVYHILRKMKSDFAAALQTDLLTSLCLTFFSPRDRITLKCEVINVKKVYEQFRQHPQLVRLHLLLFAILAALVIWGCPIYNLLHIRCPGCGLTRAWLSFLRGDLKRALEFHLFFLPMPPFIVLFVHRDVKALRKWRKAIDIALYTLVFLVFVYHIFRTVFL